MDAYMTTLGWWNLVGSLIMIGFFNERFGQKMLNEWTGIFATRFTLNYWSKFWLGWAIGLNIFFGIINICAVFWAQVELKVVIISFDIAAYVAFILLCIWGKRTGHTGPGLYSCYIIFGIWLAWGIFTFMYK